MLCVLCDFAADRRRMPDAEAVVLPCGRRISITRTGSIICTSIPPSHCWCNNTRHMWQTKNLTVGHDGLTKRERERERGGERRTGTVADINQHGWRIRVVQRLLVRCHWQRDVIVDYWLQRLSAFFGGQRRTLVPSAASGRRRVRGAATSMARRHRHRHLRRRLDVWRPWQRPRFRHGRQSAVHAHGDQHFYRQPGFGRLLRLCFWFAAQSTLSGYCRAWRGSFVSSINNKMLWT